MDCRNCDDLHNALNHLISWIDQHHPEAAQNIPHARAALEHADRRLRSKIELEATQTSHEQTLREPSEQEDVKAKAKSRICGFCDKALTLGLYEFLVHVNRCSKSGRSEQEKT